MAGTQIEHDDVQLATFDTDLFVPTVIDGAVGVASFRTLGTGAQQACAGNDPRLVTIIFVDSEVPTGVKNHSNKIFTLANPPIAGSEHVFKNGLRLSPTDDYTIVTNTITLVKAPKAADTLLVDYRR